MTKSVLFFNMLACLSVCTIKQPSPFPASTRCTKTKGNIKPMECIDCVSMAHRHKHHESVDGRRIFVFVLFFCLCVLTTTKPTKRHTSVSFCKVLCSQQAQAKEQRKKRTSKLIRAQVQNLSCHHKQTQEHNKTFIYRHTKRPSYTRTKQPSITCR